MDNLPTLKGQWGKANCCKWVKADYKREKQLIVLLGLIITVSFVGYSFVDAIEKDFSQGNCSIPDTHFRIRLVISCHFKQWMQIILLRD